MVLASVTWFKINMKQLSDKSLKRILFFLESSRCCASVATLFLAQLCGFCTSVSLRSQILAIIVVILIRIQSFIFLKILMACPCQDT